MNVSERLHPLRKSLRVQRQYLPPLEFRVTSWDTLKIDAQISSPAFVVNNTTWRITLIPPEESKNVGDFSNLEVRLTNLSDRDLKASVVCSVWANQPDSDTSRQTPQEDDSIAYPNACELGITTFKAGGGQALMCCKDITFETLLNTTVLGVACNIRIYGDIEVIDNSDTEVTETNGFKETLTLGRDLRTILVFDVKSHLPAPAMTSSDGNGNGNRTGTGTGTCAGSGSGIGADGIPSSPESPASSTGVERYGSGSGHTDSLGLGACGSVPQLVTHAPLSDIVLVAKGITETVRIHAHRCILAARSPVFRKKLSRPLASTQLFFNGGTYFLGDIHPSVARELVIFIYSDEVSMLALSQHAVPLLLAAAKYQVDGLIHTTERYLMDNISPNVAAQYLLIATSWRLSVLEQAAARYIASNLSKVKAEDPSWGHLSAVQCRLLMEFADQAQMVASSPSIFTSLGPNQDIIPAKEHTEPSAEGKQEVASDRAASAVVAEG